MLRDQLLCISLCLGFFLHPPQLIEVMQMYVYQHFQCSDFIHVDECVQNDKSDGYKRQGEVQRVTMEQKTLL